MSIGTQMILRLAADLVVDGAGNPVSAALARAARMRTFAAPGPFAAMLGVDEITVRRAEAGLVSVDALPAPYLAYLDEADPSLDLVGLRQLARQADEGVGSPAVGHGGPDGYGDADVVDLAARRAARARVVGQRVC